MFAKLGPHVQFETSPAMDWARVAPIVKELDTTNALRAAPPGAITIFRKYYEFQDINRSGADVANEILGALGGFHPSYVELFNETKQRVGDGLERHVEFTREAVDVLHRAGVAVAGFSFSTGQPEGGFVPNFSGTDDWLYLRDQGFAGVDSVAIHEYWGHQGFTLWNALRHRKVHEWLGGQHPPFVITECGRDAVEGGAAGWLASGISAEQYLQELVAYDYAIQQDPYMIGGTPFTAGAAGGKWLYFDVDTLVPAILGAGPVAEPIRLSGWLMLGALAFAAGSVMMLLNTLQPYDILELQEGEPIPPGYVEV